MFVIREDNNTGAGLQQALHLDIDLLANRAVGVINDDHGPIGQVANALAFVFAFANNLQGKSFPRQNDRFQSRRKLVQIDARHQLQFRDLREIVIVGERGNDLERALWSEYLPTKVVAMDSGFDKDAAHLIPLLIDRKMINGTSTAYVCEGFVCKSPVTTVEDLLVQLDGQNNLNP